GVDPLSRRELWEIILDLVNGQGLTVLLSTSYLDEAERCGHVVILHEGKVLAQGRPAEVAALAAGRTFLTEPPARRKARELQARLLDDPGVVDACPEGGPVRLVPAATGGALPPGAAVHRAPPRFEDGFMVLLRRVAAPRHEAGHAPVVAQSPAVVARSPDRVTTEG